MTKQAHTRGPWELERSDDGEVRRIIDADGEHVTYIDSTRYIYGQPDPEAEANAARIVACVNACEGMDEPAVEIERLKEELAATQFELAESLPLVLKLQNERNEALDALEALHRSDSKTYKGIHEDEWNNRAEIVLRKHGRK